MALPKKARRVSRMLAHSSAVAYVPKRRTTGGYIVEHAGTGHTHRAGEACDVCRDHAAKDGTSKPKVTEPSTD